MVRFISFPLVSKVSRKRGDRQTEFYGAPYIGRGMAENNFVSVTISYRLNTLFPVPIMDVAKAFKWVFENIEIYGGDVSKIFVSGHSAGTSNGFIFFVKLTFC